MHVTLPKKEHEKDSYSLESTTKAILITKS